MMPFRPYAIFCLFALMLLPTGLCHAEEVPKSDWESLPSPSPHLEEAQFRWWFPEEAETVRGILFVIPGRNGDARNAVNDKELRVLATTHQFAIIGCRLFHSTGAYQNDPDGKTTTTLEKAIVELGIANGHPMASKQPVAFLGSSAGANTAVCFAWRRARRTLAVVSIKCPNGPGAFSQAKAAVPMLICIGKNDRPTWVESSIENYEKGRQAQAVWTLAFHPSEGHASGASRPLALAFLNEVIPLRLETNGKSESLKTVDLLSAWLGDPENLETAPAAQFNGLKRRATWLPGPETAAAWKSYLEGGE